MTRASLADLSPSALKQAVEQIRAQTPPAQRKASAKVPKYRNKKVEADGYTFDSGAEAREYYRLKTLLHANQITELRVHPAWDIIVAGVKICRYVADFSYREAIDRQQFMGWSTPKIVDVKGVKTPAYRLKKRLMLACHGIEIVEVKA